MRLTAAQRADLDARYDAHPPQSWLSIRIDATLSKVQK